MDIARPGAAGTSVLGQSVRRVEDPELLTGGATFVSDVVVEGMVHAAYVRASIAHARIREIDVTAAVEMPGVVAVLTATDLDVPAIQHPVITQMVPPVFARPVLAGDVIRFVGEIVAVVVADSPSRADDAAEHVIVDFEELPAVVDPARAAEDELVLFPGFGTNMVYRIPFESGDHQPAADDVVVEATFVNQRVAPAAIEPNAIVVVPASPDRPLTLYAGTQMPHNTRNNLARFLSVDPEEIRVVTPHVGGAFGSKTDVEIDYVLAVAVSRAVGRPLRYVQRRTENLLTVHGRDQVQDVRLVAGPDGILRALEVSILANGGAYPGTGAFLPLLTRMMATGVYRIPRVRYDIAVVATNTAPIGSFRGAGRPEAAALIERAMDMLATKLAMDPAELRRRNFLPSDAFPYETPTGSIYDTGDYGGALDVLLAAADYPRLRREQAQRRANGSARLLGIGLAVYVEVTAVTGNDELIRMEVNDEGTVTVFAGTSAHGQGHRTTFAQIVADRLGVPFDRIVVVEGDTALVATGEGTQGSRSVQVGGSAVAGASELLLATARELAAAVLEAAVEDIEQLADGRFTVAGVPASAIGWGELARAGRSRPNPEGQSSGLAAEFRFDQERSTFPFGAHLAVVDVDVETGAVRLERLIAVDDCGTVINPLLATGQVHGGLAAGAAQALLEEVFYDGYGNVLTATFADYGIPSAAELPSFDTYHTVTPTPVNPLGAKGIGESGSIGSTPAVQNAVIDALAHAGVTHIDLPVTPQRVWAALRSV